MTPSAGPSIPGQPPTPSSEIDDTTTTDRPAPANFALRRIIAVTAIALVAAGGWWAVSNLFGESSTAEPAPLPPGAVPVDAWAPAWALDDVLPVAAERLSGIREISPFWFAVDPTLDIAADEFVSADDTAAFLNQIEQSGNQFVPSIRDELPAGDMATVLANPSLRQQHIDKILAFAERVDADGIDLDYEKFAFSDGRDTWATTRPNWVTFVTELAAELHTRDLTLTVSIPPIYDADRTSASGYWVYDHGAIAEHVDAIRIMTYDYSVTEVGPIAPIEWVRQSIAGVSAAVAPEHHSKLILGIPAYGANWVVGTTGTCPSSAEGRTTITSRNATDLAELRGGQPILNGYDLEWAFQYELTVADGDQSCVQTREVRWVDAEGAAARVRLAREAGWGGVSLWALGYDDDEVWEALTTAATEPLPAPTTTEP